LWQIPGVPEFRTAQYCPLARAAEVVGERWALLVVRELFDMAPDPSEPHHP
jgi:DNA-binding HxlR family transcriptional regulator